MTPHDYQYEAAEFAVARECAAELLDMGLGKTLTMLTAINGLKRVGMIDKPVLVVAPLRVAHSVWTAEAKKWKPFRNLKVRVAHAKTTYSQKNGDKISHERAGKIRDILSQPADIYTTTPEVVAAMPELFARQWSMLIADESTKYKNHASGRTKALHSLVDDNIFDRRYILSAGPIPNGLHDLWSQYYILDKGARLGKNITRFREQYFFKYRDGDYWKYREQHNAQNRIGRAVSDISLRMRGEDYLDLPPLRIQDEYVDLPPKAMTAYRKFEREMFFSLDDVEAETFSPAARYNMCRQIANGGLYGEDRSMGVVHHSKVDRIAQIASKVQPLMVAYQFRHDLERLQQRFGKSVPFIGAGVSAKKSDDIVERWNWGEIPLLFVQPAAMSHGLNMQNAARHMLWMGVPDDLDQYKQTIGRIYRQGASGEEVVVYRIFASGTVDLLGRDRIERKNTREQSLLNDLKEYRNAA